MNGKILLAAFVVLVAAVVVLSLLLVRTPSAAAPAPAPAPSHPLQMVSDECYEAGPATPC